MGHANASQSWRMPDELWAKVRPLLPAGKPHPLGLCWLLRISVPKKSANDDSTSSFSWQSTHQISGVKVSHTTVYFLILERIS